MQQIVLPTVIQKKRTTVVGGERVARLQYNLGVDMTKQGLADVHAMLRQITIQTTAEQMRLENPPQIVIVDGNPSKPVQQANFKTEVFYGVTVPRDIMIQMQQALRRAIRKVTTANSGDLQNIAASWQWLLVTAEGTTALAGPQDIDSFRSNDALFLVPKLNYAGIVNNVIVKKYGQRFTAAAVDTVRKKSKFRMFKVTSGVTKEHQLPGEISKYGSPWIAIRVAKSRRRRR